MAPPPLSPQQSSGLATNKSSDRADIPPQRSGDKPVQHLQSSTTEPMKFNVKDLRRPLPNYRFDPNTNWKKIPGYENYDIAEPATWAYIDEHTDAGHGYSMAPFTVYSREVMAMFFENYNIEQESAKAKDLMKYLPANLSPFGKFKPIMLAPLQLKNHQKTITNELRKSYKLALKEKRIHTFLARLINVPVPQTQYKPQLIFKIKVPQRTPTKSKQTSQKKEKNDSSKVRLFEDDESESGDEEIPKIAYGTPVTNNDDGEQDPHSDLMENNYYNEQQHAHVPGSHIDDSQEQANQAINNHIHSGHGEYQELDREKQPDDHAQASLPGSYGLYFAHKKAYTEHIQKNDQSAFNQGHLKRKFDEMPDGCNTDTFENHLTNIYKMFEEFRNVHNESAGLRKRLRISETENVALKISNQELQHRAAEKEGRIEKLAYLETLVRAGYKKLEEKPKRKDQGSTGTPSNGN